MDLHFEISHAKTSVSNWTKLKLSVLNKKENWTFSVSLFVQCFWAIPQVSLVSQPIVFEFSYCLSHREGFLWWLLSLVFSFSASSVDMIGQEGNNGRLPLLYGPRLTSLKITFHTASQQSASEMVVDQATLAAVWRLGYSIFRKKHELDIMESSVY